MFATALFLLVLLYYTGLVVTITIMFSHNLPGYAHYGFAEILAVLVASLAYPIAIGVVIKERA